MIIKCDKCRAPAAASSGCQVCGRQYHRCADHDADAGVRRSIHSHAALYHPRKAP
jgi:hypothetical protein